MSLLFIVFLSCIALGSIVGFLAGLLGIGGGLIIVPALVYLLPLLGVHSDIVMPIALATSLGSIVITSSSAALAHHRNNNIDWALAKPFIMVVALGALLGAFIAHFLTTQALTSFFAYMVMLLALYMLFSIASTRERQLPSKLVLQFIGGLTGIVASLLGIAGGAILVPTLTYFGLSIRKSIGIATVCGVMVALFGSIGYIITGLGQVNLPTWSIGYIYLPALVGIIISSALFAPLGVKYATKLPVKTLKRFFAVFLIFVAIKMLSSG
jgi:uncharacterized membrane protein YfcA